MQIDGLSLENCRTEQGLPDDQRPVIEQCSFRRVTVKRSRLIGAVLRDVTIDGIRGDMDSRFLTANEFERVTIRGKVGDLVIGTLPSHLPFEEPYRRVLAEADSSSSEWSLDVSGALGKVSIRGYSAARIRIDPETQAVVRRVDLLDGRWRPLVEGTLFTVQIDLALRMGWPDVVLVADRATRRFGADMKALARLRAEGVVSVGTTPSPTD